MSDPSDMPTETPLPDAVRNTRLRLLPGIDRLLELAKKIPEFALVPHAIQLQAARAAVARLRGDILAGMDLPPEKRLTETALNHMQQAAQAAMTPHLAPLINATGVVVHTNLGRSLLAPTVIEHMKTVATRYSNLEYDLPAGRRGSRYSHVEALLCELTEAEAAMVVNNNAGAVFLALGTLAPAREVIVSRGELVEIGGSFRIPDVMSRSGAILKEVGTTNRTHLKDYVSAITDQTGLLLKVHTSNYSIVGFSASVGVKALAQLGRETGIPVMEDLGSGTLIDLARHGLMKEPTVQESVASGADIVTFSGDKLLGGPQAGIIVGKRMYIDPIRQNPITRALRIDKLTLAALEGTLLLYRDEPTALQTIPTLRMLTMPLTEISARAERLAALLTGLSERIFVEIREMSSRAGGGSLPLLELPTRGLAVRVAGFSAHMLEEALRSSRPPIIGRIEEDRFLMDPRTIDETQFYPIATVFANLDLKKGCS